MQKKKIVFLVIIFLLVGKAGVPLIVYADDMPTAAPVPAVTSIVDSPTPTLTDTLTPTPMFTPIPTPSPTPDLPTLDASNSATVTNDVSGISDSGNNTTINSQDPSQSSTRATQVSFPNASPTPTSPPNILTTDNTVATTTQTNQVNTTGVNSRIIYQTINLFITQNGTVDLSAPQTIASDVLVGSNANTPINNVLLTSNDNYASLNNSVMSNANTGDNTATSSGDLILKTGNADSLVTLTNTVNVTMIDSVVHIVTVNIYGVVNGNLILPTITETSCTNCSVSPLTSHNTANVSNTVTANADTGDNSVASSDSASLVTGNANTAINIVNLVNTIFNGADYQGLYINTLGTWNGNFLGWGDMNATSGGQTTAATSTTDTLNDASGCSLCNAFASVTNTAEVHNTVTSDATTGNNKVTGNGKAAVQTGNANSFVAITNLINALFYQSNVYIGFVNIFGTLNGDIGDASKFPTPTPSPAVAENAVQTSDGITHKEDGGKLLMSIGNNVGAFVHPGDTVIVTAKVKNAGSGAVYTSAIHLTLIHDGLSQSIGDFPLGDIPTGQGKKLSTGIVLGSDAITGSYTIHAEVTGTTGDDDTPLSAAGDSSFAINAIASGVQSNGKPTVVLGSSMHVPQQEVLGTHTTKPLSNTQEKLYYLLGFILGLYVVIRIIRDYRYFGELFAKRSSLRQRFATLRLLLL